MNKVNKKLYTIEYILDTMSYIKISDTLNNLKKGKFYLLHDIEKLDEFEDEYEISLLEEQLKYLQHNIDTFIDALVHHEDAAIKHLIINDEVVQFCLN